MTFDGRLANIAGLIVQSLHRSYTQNVMKKRCMKSRYK